MLIRLTFVGQLSNGCRGFRDKALFCAVERASKAPMLIEKHKNRAMQEEVIRAHSIFRLDLLSYQFQSVPGQPRKVCLRSGEEHPPIKIGSKFLPIPLQNRWTVVPRIGRERY